MPCSDQHFIGVSLGEGDNPPEFGKPKKQWGGRRPGAGAPKGNLNAFRHGKYSTQHKQLAQLLAHFPEAGEALAKLALRRRKYDKQKEEGAALIMAEILRRLGESLLNPGDNHLEHNQALLSNIRQLEALIKEIPKKPIKTAPRVNQPTAKQAASK